MNKLDAAMNTLKRCRSKYKNFKMDGIKVAKLVSLMIDNKYNFRDIELFLETHRQHGAANEKMPQILTFEKLLQRLAFKGNADVLEKLFNASLKYKYINATKETTSPLVKVHLEQDNWHEAFNAYKSIVKKFQLTPMTSVLLNKLFAERNVNTDDAIDEVYAINASIYGEESATYTLAIAHLENGDAEAARRIFSTIRLRQDRISRKLGKYVKFEQLLPVETLLKATKDLPGCDRHEIYQAVLDIYSLQNKANEAIELWQSYLNENDAMGRMIPRQKFQQTLAKLLQTNNIKVPFEIVKKTQ